MEPLLYDPAHHAGVWHEFSLMRHFSLVTESAQRLYWLTRVNVVHEAMLHDIGKLAMFPRSVETGDYMFFGHEEISAKLAAEVGMCEASQQFIRYHNISYQYGPQRIVDELCGGDSELVRRMLVLATADTTGKGWVPAQCKQRPEVAAKFEEVGRLAGLDDDFITTLTTAITEW